jgi:hypothetical protein
MVTARNTQPVANAGPDQSVTRGSLVQLDGSGSSDADGDALTYAWTIAARPPGSATSLSNATAMDPTFTADVEGTWVLQLIVRDGEEDSAPDLAMVTATAPANTPPVADAGPDQSVMPGSVVQLDGSGSSDADGDALSWSWAFASRPSGSTASLSNSTAMKPMFTADVAGSYLLDLTVSDGKANDTDRVIVTATAPILQPPRPGHYSGTTSDGKPISFVVAADSKSIEPGLSVAFRILCVYCSGTVTSTLTGSSIAISNRHFSVTLGSSAIPGYFAVSGDVASETRFTGSAAHRSNPPSSMSCGYCSLSQVTWTATWTGPAPSLGVHAGVAGQPGSVLVRTIRDGLCLESRYAVRK